MADIFEIENRLAMTSPFPALFAEQSVLQVEEYPSRLLAALRAAAPAARAGDPCVVVLTPCVQNAAYFEHTLLARLMGVELVEGRIPAARQAVPALGPAFPGDRRGVPGGAQPGTGPDILQRGPDDVSQRNGLATRTPP